MAKTIGALIETKVLAAYSRINIAKALSIIGLKKTYIVLPKTGSYTINRLTSKKGELALQKIASVTDPKPLMIGRVGTPEPKLGIGWKNSMTFYGSWFDGLAVSDTDYRIRNSILSLSRNQLLEQVQRDDKYGLIGTYYSVFLKILSVNKGAPMVVLDDSLLALGSFPVIVPKLSDKDLERELAEGLRISLRKEIVETSSLDTAGIEVDEVTNESAEEYFPARNS